MNIFVTNTILLLLIGIVWIIIGVYIYTSYTEEINPTPRMNDNNDYKTNNCEVTHINFVDIDESDIKIICK